MPRDFEPNSERQFYLDFLLAIATKFEPEKTGPFNRSHYMATKLRNVIHAHLLGLREQVLPLARALVAWMGSQPAPPDGKDPQESFNVYQWWKTLGLCKWLIDGDPAVPEFSRASEADWRQWDKFDRFEPNGAKLLMREGLELALPLNLAARRYDVGLKLCEEAGLTTKPSSAPAIVRAELMYGQWACRHLAADGKLDAAYIAKGEEMLRKVMSESFIMSGYYGKMAMWLKAIYHDSGLTRTPEETILKAYDTMTGVEKPAFAKI
ncbi:hypothetical protein [Reyranella aquatilis]|uniref:Uncharacterized protein n=1 Tax=Reyranella aquatilis TaxID=2035356 RepID=A0ABS8KPW0_9HYPH|nr:hypothetical protein [Reyranella aquatilis]MCC8427713.1 hypothetical protein [Reyranella aquatilis]